jgi:Ca2+-binding EF-hand superfamily protein
LLAHGHVIDGKATTMSDQVQFDNIDRVFAIFDLDGDGGISKDDFTTVGLGVAREFGLDADAPEARRLLDAYDEVWDYIRGADVDADEVVSREEFRDAHTSGRLTSEGLLEKWEGATRRCFEVADVDGDGYIDLDGLAKIYRGAGLTDRKVAETAFAGMDVDDDGRLDLAELSANVRGVFTATDESAKGAHMVG